MSDEMEKGYGAEIQIAVLMFTLTASAGRISATYVSPAQMAYHCWIFGWKAKLMVIMLFSGLKLQTT
jgi:hypothetical protein